ncbi:MAG: hypothetical protein MPN21_03690 [Thermoanaerobaculia bacterium]|nr:hypothetical protein [Thermoanaerobaculia bacterium]
MSRILGFGLLCLWATSIAGEQPAEVDSDSVPIPSSFHEETDVVAIDRMVGLEGTAGWLRGGKLPRRLGLGEFEAWVLPLEEDQRSRTALTPVVVERVVRGLPERAEPWSVVVLLDAMTASTRTVRWAVGLLADHAEELTSLGPVTVWMSSADGGLKTLLLPSEETQRVKELLSRLALLTEGEDSVLQRRWDWVEDGENEMLAAGIAQEETVSLRRALDARLLHLREQARTSGPRRLLLWVTDGFDLSPSDFYGVEMEQPDALAGHFEDAIHALAADGWIAAALRPPDEDPYRGKARGVRIGKWRFVGIPPFLVYGAYEAERDPEKSEALLELGDQRLAADDIEGAADAYSRAFYHFWGDPKTADRQSVALLRLSDCLEILGDRSGARRARGLAAELDPVTAERHLARTMDPGNHASVARLLDPLEPLNLLAEATSGVVIAEASELDDALFEWQRRLHLTLQLPAGLEPGIHRVEVRWRGETARVPGWVRFGEAPAVDEAEIRRGRRP